MCIKTKKISLIICSTALLFISAGCSVSPFSPSNRPRIKNNGGEIGDMNNNQNGVMAEILSLKNRIDVMAQEVENLQNGLINSNNKNFGVQIFQGEGGLAAGVAIFVALAVLAFNYKIKSERYKKTAEIFGDEIKKMNNSRIEDEILSKAMLNKVEKNAYQILNR